MIKGFRSKPLKLLWEKDDDSKLPVPNKNGVRRILGLLNAAVNPDDLNVPGFDYHPLKGKPQRHAVSASGNCRVTYGWEGQDAIDVDLEDYH